MDRRLVLILLVAVSGLGCPDSIESGSSGLLPLLPQEVTATWDGTWVSVSGSQGAIQLVLTQSPAPEPPTALDPPVTGTARMTGTPCFDTGRFDGEVDIVTLSGRLRSIPPPGGQSTGLNVELTVLNRGMAGTYEIATHPDPACQNESGTIEASRP